MLIDTEAADPEALQAVFQHEPLILQLAGQASEDFGNFLPNLSTHLGKAGAQRAARRDHQADDNNHSGRADFLGPFGDRRRRGPCANCDRKCRGASGDRSGAGSDGCKWRRYRQPCFDTACSAAAAGHCGRHGPPARRACPRHAPWPVSAPFSSNTVWGPICPT